MSTQGTMGTIHHVDWSVIIRVQPGQSHSSRVPTMELTSQGQQAGTVRQRMATYLLQLGHMIIISHSGISHKFLRQRILNRKEITSRLPQIPQRFQNKVFKEKINFFRSDIFPYNIRMKTAQRKRSGYPLHFPIVTYSVEKL